MSGITGVSSYPATVETFNLHWQNVNMALAPAELVLPNGTTQADFQQMKSVLATSFTDTVVAGEAERRAAANLLLARGKLQPRFVQFGQSVRLYLNQSRFADGAPKTPTLTAGLSVYQTAGGKMDISWSAINGAGDLAPFQPPLLLPDFSAPSSPGYTLAQFQAELALLETLFSDDSRATLGATQQRANRNALLPPIYEAMKNYRAACLLILPKGSPLLATLPRLTPPPGTTPKPVVVSGAWDNQLGQARLTWPAATASNVDKLQVRACTGGTYKAADEEIIADLPAATTHWEGDWGLTAPGAIATFKVFVMTTTGNENGGKAVKIVRPEV